MNVFVYHVKDILAPGGRTLLGEIGDGILPIGFPDNHDLVAEVEVHSEGMRALDEAYKLTQNLDRSWTKNAFVKVMSSADRFRSTHTGDVVVMKDVPYVCWPSRWQPITSPDMKIFRKSGEQEGFILRPPTTPYGKDRR